MRPQLATTTLAAVFLATACGGGEGAGDGGQRIGPEAQEADDLQPRYLGAENAKPKRVHLELVRRVQWEIPSEYAAPRAVVALAVGDDSLYALDFLTRTIWQFTVNGEFIRRFGPSPKADLAIQRGLDLKLGEAEGRLFVADSNHGVIALSLTGEPLERLPQPPQAYSLAQLPGGRLAVNSSKVDGPYWTIIDGGEIVTRFFSRRRRLLPPGEEFLVGYTPHSFGDVDSEGNIYVGTQGAPQIRKFGKDGSYVGDFRLQPDPNLPPAPERLTEEQRRLRSMGVEMPDFTRLMRLCVVQDRCLVVQFDAPGGQTRLHFYGLDGTAAFEQQSWPTSLLSCDAKGLLYFRPPDDNALEVYRLAPEMGRTEEGR